MKQEPSIAVVVLAAGEGSRMKSARPKPLHEVGGESLLRHALRAAAALNPARVTVVTGVGAADVAAEAEAALAGVEIAEQTERLGTAHAVLAARGTLANTVGDAVVLYADTPFVSGGALADMRRARAHGADVVALGFRAADPSGYGRMVMRSGMLERIVEARDATPEERAIDLCNSGVMMADSGVMLSLLGEVGCDNAKGEYYLTDIVALASARGLACAVVECPEAETMGVNSRADLAAAEAAFQARARARAMAEGATLIAPETVWFSHDTALGRDVTVEPNVIFGPGVTVEDGAVIRGHSHLEGCVVRAEAVIGPFARLRPGAEIGAGARVGNFVEVKNARLGPGAKANHLAYVGDAMVGARTNIGAGAVTCNYDGVMKHQTVIGEEAFIGTNASLVAPLTVGDGAYVASGSVITRDVAPNAMAISRPKEQHKPGFAARLRSKLRAIRSDGEAKGWRPKE